MRYDRFAYYDDNCVSYDFTNKVECIKTIAKWLAVTYSNISKRGGEEFMSEFMIKPQKIQEQIDNLDECFESIKRSNEDLNRITNKMDKSSDFDKVKKHWKRCAVISQLRLQIYKVLRKHYLGLCICIYLQRRKLPVLGRIKGI